MISKAENSLPLKQEVTDRRTMAKGVKKAPQRLSALLRNTQLKQWDSKAVDIKLLPVSCVDIYRDLVVRKKAIHLAATNPVTLRSGEAKPNFGAQANADSKLNSKLSAGATSAQISACRSGVLTTQHDSAALKQRCQRLERETARRNGEISYSLYIAAGFAVTVTDNGKKHRAPLLLVPVDIFRSSESDGPFAIRYRGGTLRLNPHIAESCNTHVDQIIEPFDDAADMRDYLRATGRKLHSSLNCQVSANTGLFSLQSNVLTDISPIARQQAELQRTKPGIQFQALPATPDCFNSQLAIRMLRFVDPENLDHALLNFIGTPAVNPNPAPLNNALKSGQELSTERLEKSHKCARWLINIGLGHWQLQHITGLPDRIDSLLESINDLRNRPEFLRHIDADNQTIGMLQKLYRARSYIDNAPPEMQHHAISLHADANTRLLLQKAKIQAASIQHELSTSAETFHLSELPGSHKLFHLIETIAKREQSSQLANPHYFRARRQLNEILKTHNGLVTDNDLAKLETLAKTMRFSEQFDADPYYKRCFGSLFDGVSTNWQRLDSVVNFSRNLAHDLGSAELVGRLNESWPSFQRDFSKVIPLLKPAATSAYKLTLLVPSFINNETSLEHAVSTAAKFRSRVNQWQRYLQKSASNPDCTPFSMIETYPRNKSEVSVLLAPQEYDDRIYHHIIGSQLDQETISATAQWLYNTLTHLQIDSATVRRYLDSDLNLDTSRARPL